MALVVATTPVLSSLLAQLTPTCSPQDPQRGPYWQSIMGNAALLHLPQRGTYFIFGMLEARDCVRVLGHSGGMSKGPP